MAEVPWEPVALAATRWTMLRGWNFPLWAILPVLGLPLILTFLTQNVLCLFAGVPLLTHLARRFLGDQSRPREVWLGFLSGQAFADRGAWGGATKDPLDG